MSINQIMQRINQIESRFAVVGRPIRHSSQVDAGRSNFDNVLQQEISSADSQTVQRVVEQTARRYNVDPKLALSLAKAESEFNPKAVSSAGAIGVMQLMPETAADLGVKNPYDVAENVDGGVRYLKQMIDRYNGNVSLALAAYNAGSGAVEKHNGVPPYAETQQYVAKILRGYGKTTS